MYCSKNEELGEKSTLPNKYSGYKYKSPKTALIMALQSGKELFCNDRIKSVTM